MKERNIPASPFSKRQFAHSFSDGRIREYLLVELGLGHLDRLRALLQIANLHRLVVVDLDEPCKFIRDLQPALLLRTFQDRESP